MTALENARSMFYVDGMSVREVKLATGVLMVVCDTDVNDWMVVTIMFDRDGKLVDTKIA